MREWRWPGLLRRFSRPENGRLLAGVCAGLAEGLGVDVSLMRLAFLVLLLASGLGLVLYFVLWLLMPTERLARPSQSTGEVVRQNLQGMTEELREIGTSVVSVWGRDEEGHWPRPLSRRWIAVLLIVAGAGILLQSLGFFRWLGGWRVLGLLAIILGVGLLLSLSSEGRR